MHRFILIITALLAASLLWGQTPETEAISDSLQEMRESAIQSEFGIRESLSLSQVAEILEVEDLAMLKRTLGLEAQNEVLDNRSLRQLGITPYNAFIASQTVRYGFSELDRLIDVAAHLNMPIKKLKNMLGPPLDPLSNDMDNRSLQALGISPERVVEIKTEFDDQRIPYGISLTMVGMLVVFSALFITSLVISQIIRFNKASKKPVTHIKISSTGKVVKTAVNTSQDIVIAAITALYIYEHNIKERRRLQLTFNRSNANTWRSSASLRMPNREYRQKRS